MYAGDHFLEKYVYPPSVDPKVRLRPNPNLSFPPSFIIVLLLHPTSSSRGPSDPSYVGSMKYLTSPIFDTFELCKCTFFGVGNRTMSICFLFQYFMRQKSARHSLKAEGLFKETLPPVWKIPPPLRPLTQLRGGRPHPGSEVGGRRPPPLKKEDKKGRPLLFRP